jgi:hypothetical protein
MRGSEVLASDGEGRPTQKLRGVGTRAENVDPDRLGALPEELFHRGKAKGHMIKLLSQIRHALTAMREARQPDARAELPPLSSFEALPPKTRVKILRKSLKGLEGPEKQAEAYCKVRDVIQASPALQKDWADNPKTLQDEVLRLGNDTLNLRHRKALLEVGGAGDERRADNVLRAHGPFTPVQVNQVRLTGAHRDMMQSNDATPQQYTYTAEQAIERHAVEDSIDRQQITTNYGLRDVGLMGHHPDPEGHRSQERQRLLGLQEAPRTGVRERSRARAGCR